MLSFQVESGQAVDSESFKSKQSENIPNSVSYGIFVHVL